MPDSPPTSPGPLPPPPPWRANPIVSGTLIHMGCVLVTCFVVPLAMNSNIWPIAGVFWSVLTVPVAAGTGALIGLMVKKLRPAMAMPLEVITGVAVAVAAAIIMFNNW